MNPRLLLRTVLTYAGLSGLLIDISSSPAAAQGLSQDVGLGSISGVITDTSGATVPEAKITLMDLKTNAQRVVQTSNLGFYTFPGLPGGSYRIMVEKAGFASQVRSSVPLQVQQNLTVPFVLSVGNLADKIEVTAEAPVLEATNSTIGQVVNQVQTTELPLNGRQFSQLTLLAPGAAPVGGWLQSFHSVNLGAGGISPSVNGASGNFNNFSLDGVDNNSKFANYWAIAPPPDAIQEVRVQTGLYAGSNVNVATKAGTNEFHGSMWEFLRNDKLDARNTFDARKPPYRQNQYGFAAGGPAYIPKLLDGRKTGTWIFGYWEGYRSRKSRTYFATVPTPAMLQGDLSTFLGPQVGTDSAGSAVLQRQIFDPFSTRPDPAKPGQFIRDPFPNNRIPNQFINPVSLEYLRNFYPAANTSAFPNNLVTVQSTATDADQFGIRFDQKIGQSDSLFIRGNVENSSSISPHPLVTTPMIKENRPRTLAGSYTRIWSPTLLMNVSLGYTRDFTPVYNPGVSRDFQQRLGMSELIPPYKYKGDIYLASTMNFGPTFSSPSQLGWFLGAPDYSYQMNGNVTKTKSNHTLSMGVIGLKWRHIGDPQPSFFIGFSSLTTAQPAFAATTGESYASFLLGLSNNAINFIIPQKNSDGWMWDLFLHDQWKITPKLTANLGLHWNYRVGPYNLRDEISVFNIAIGKWQWAAKNPVTGEGPNLRRSVFDPDYKNFAPRVGLAYQLLRKTVLRTNFSISYDHGMTMVQGNQELLGNYPFGSRASTFNQNVDIPSGVILTRPLPGPVTPDASTTPAITGNPWNRSPYLMQWNAGFQQEIAPNMVLSADYVGSRGRRLMMQIGYNAARAPGPGPINARQPFPQFGPFSLDTNEGRSNYDALQAKVERRFSHGLTFLASYTWSKTLGTVSSHVGNNVQDPYNINASRGPLIFDVPHMFVFSSVYEIPFGRRRAFGSGTKPALNAIAGGWSIGAIASVYSGTPLTTLIPFDNANTGSGRQRADVVGNPQRPGFHTRQAWFDPGAFAVPARYTYGNSGEGAMRGPGLRNLDFTALKDFRLAEGRGLEFRFESFNFLNNTNLGTPGTFLPSFNFARILSAREPRDIQLGLKFHW